MIDRELIVSLLAERGYENAESIADEMLNSERFKEDILDYICKFANGDIF